MSNVLSLSHSLQVECFALHRDSRDFTEPWRAVRICIAKGSSKSSLFHTEAVGSKSIKSQVSSAKIALRIQIVAYNEADLATLLASKYISVYTKMPRDALFRLSSVCRSRRVASLY